MRDEVKAFETFYPAEDYHQAYYELNKEAPVGQSLPNGQIQENLGPNSTCSKGHSSASSRSISLSSTMTICAGRVPRFSHRFWPSASRT